MGKLTSQVTSDPNGPGARRICRAPVGRVEAMVRPAFFSYARMKSATVITFAPTPFTPNKVMVLSNPAISTSVLAP